MFEKLAAIRERLNEITPGPWEWSLWGGVRSDSDSIADVWSNNLPADGVFIAHAPDDIRALLAYVAELQADLADCQRDFEEMID